MAHSLLYSFIGEIEQPFSCQSIKKHDKTSISTKAKLQMNDIVSFFLIYKYLK